MRNVLKPFAESVLISLGLTTEASAIDATIGKKIFGSVVTTWKISSEEITYNLEILKSFEESGLLIKSLAREFKMKQKTDIWVCY